MKVGITKEHSGGSTVFGALDRHLVTLHLSLPDILASLWKTVILVYPTTGHSRYADCPHYLDVMASIGF